MAAAIPVAGTQVKASSKDPTKLTPMGRIAAPARNRSVKRDKSLENVTVTPSSSDESCTASYSSPVAASSNWKAPPDVPKRAPPIPKHRAAGSSFQFQTISRRRPLPQVPDVEPYSNRSALDLWEEKNSPREKVPRPTSLLDPAWEVLVMFDGSSAFNIAKLEEHGYGLEVGDKAQLQAEDLESNDFYKNSSSIFFIDTQRYTPYYQHYFAGKPHGVYMTYDHNANPVFLALEHVDQAVVEELGVLSHSRALVFTCLPHTPTSESEHWILLQNPIRDLREEVIAQLPPEIDFIAPIKLIDHPNVEKEFIEYEQKTKRPCHKFGVLYCKNDQNTEYQMLGNQEESEEFKEFLDFLGDRVKLKGFQGYSGGLDVKTGTTGEEMVYSKHKSYEIAYHVGTMMPYTKGDYQQLARKRYIGNDIVVIIFRDSARSDRELKPIDVTAFQSNFNHVFVYVQVDRTLTENSYNKATHYRVAFASKDGCHSFAPGLPTPPIFEKDERFRNFLLTKLINSERAALYAPGFSKKLQTTNKMLLRDFAAKYAPIAQPKVSKRIARKSKQRLKGTPTHLEIDTQQKKLIEVQMKKKKKGSKTSNSSSKPPSFTTRIETSVYTSSDDSEG